MSTVNLRPFVRPELDILFVALNAPSQSNANQHWFSGDQSRFYELLYRSGLLTRQVSKANGDETVFGSNGANYRNAQFGVIDLVDDLVETSSAKVAPNSIHVNALVQKIRGNTPRFVCVIHSKVSDALNKWAGFMHPLEYGLRGPLLPECTSHFVLNYFPNGNPVPDSKKVEIFGALRDAL